jgi:DNA polymerase-3 subunit delta'
LALALDLLDALLARLARAGLQGPPAPEAAPGEAALCRRLSPGAAAARAWAELQAAASARARQGRAVNLDPAALVLDMLLAIDRTARAAAAEGAR